MRSITPMPGVQVRYEQAVYGSFPFWDRGYAILAASPGCRPEWLDALRAACQRIGEPPAAAEARGLFALRAGRGPWMIVGIGPQGADDRGRPGALAFHALFVSTRDYRRAGSDPFAFARLLRNDWTAATRALPSGTFEFEPTALATPTDPRVARIVAALTGRRRVALQADGPIDRLAREVWAALPPAIRDRASVATWAFGVGNGFDLVALPRLSGIALDPSYVDPASIESDAAPIERGGSRPRLARALPALGAVAILAGAGLGLVFRQDKGEARSPDVTLQATDRPPPDRSAYVAEPPDPAERRRVAESLADLAERFGGVKPGTPGGDEDLGAVMARLAGRLRYRGPFLSDSEKSTLAEDDDPTTRHDRALALRWDERIRRFAPDRALPEGFARGPLLWQLDTLAWSFHLDDPPSRLRSPAEVAHALADALAVDVPLSPTPLSRRYPVLAAYRAFLRRLPRR